MTVPVNERLSGFNPEGYEHTVFIVPDLPDVPFTLITIGTGFQDGPYPPADYWVSMEPSNVMYCSLADGRPYYWGITSQTNEQITIVDQEGASQDYVIVPLPDNTMFDTDESLSPAQVQLAAQQPGVMT